MTDHAPHKADAGQHPDSARYADPSPYADPVQYAPHPSAHAHAAGAPPRTSRALALVAIIVAALMALLGPLQGFVTMGLISSGAGIPMLNIVSPIFAIGIGVLALVALGFGIASLARREPARALAGAAVGIGAVGLVGLVATAIQALAYAAL